MAPRNINCHVDFFFFHMIMKTYIDKGLISRLREICDQARCKPAWFIIGISQYRFGRKGPE